MMEQTDKEPHWFAFVALSGPGQLEVHHGRLRDRDPAYRVLASAGSRYRCWISRSFTRVGGFISLLCNNTR